jgi:hypothetical protein
MSLFNPIKYLLHASFINLIIITVLIYTVRTAPNTFYPCGRRQLLLWPKVKVSNSGQHSIRWQGSNPSPAYQAIVLTNYTGWGLWRQGVKENCTTRDVQLLKWSSRIAAPVNWVYGLCGWLQQFGMTPKINVPTCSFARKDNGSPRIVLFLPPTPLHFVDISNWPCF